MQLFTMTLVLCIAVLLAVLSWLDRGVKWRPRAGAPPERRSGTAPR